MDERNEMSIAELIKRAESHKIIVRVNVPALGCYVTVTKHAALTMLKNMDPTKRVPAKREDVGDRKFLFIG